MTENKHKMSTNSNAPIPACSSTRSHNTTDIKIRRKYDQNVRGNVTIKKNNDGFKITFSKISKMLIYQIWSNKDASINKKRDVEYVKAKDWIKFFKKTENNAYTPTCVMNLDNGKRHVFVLNKAKVNKHDKVVFYVSSQDISLPSNSQLKSLKKIPQGNFTNVRFDIDSLPGWLQCSNIWVGTGTYLLGRPTCKLVCRTFLNSTFEYSATATCCAGCQSSITLNHDKTAA